MRRFISLITILVILSASQRGRGKGGNFERTKVLFNQEPLDMPKNSFKKKRVGRTSGKSDIDKDDLSVWPVFGESVKEAEARSSRRSTSKVKVKPIVTATPSPSQRSWISPSKSGDKWIDAIHSVPYSDHDMTEEDHRLFSLFPPEDFVSFLHPVEEFEMPEDYS